MDLLHSPKQGIKLVLSSVVIALENASKILWQTRANFSKHIGLSEKVIQLKTPLFNDVLVMEFFFQTGTIGSGWHSEYSIQLVCARFQFRVRPGPM